jgi:GTP1/Obg family GTP-binding protein
MKDMLENAVRTVPSRFFYAHHRTQKQRQSIERRLRAIRANRQASVDRLSNDIFDLRCLRVRSMSFGRISLSLDPLHQELAQLMNRIQALKVCLSSFLFSSAELHHSQDEIKRKKRDVMEIDIIVIDD